MNQLTLCAYALLVTAAIVSGCQQAETPNANTPPAGNNSTPAASHTQTPVRLASWEEVVQLVAAHKGKVVVLDVWSTWCTPCVREFPNLVALHQQHGDRVACMSLNCNYTGAEGETPQDARPEIEAFLQQQGATFENIISTTPDMQLLEKLGAAAVPVIRVYDKSGQLRKQFTNEEGEYGEEGFTYEQHINPLVEQLLNE